MWELLYRIEMLVFVLLTKINYPVVYLYIDKTQYTVRIARYTVHGTKCTAVVENNRTLEKFTVSIHEAKFYYSVFHKLK